MSHWRGGSDVSAEYHDSGDASMAIRLSSRLGLAVAIGLTSAIFPFAQSPAVASQTCAPNSYQWTGYYTTYFRNQGISGDIRGSGITVPNGSNQHGLVYLSSQSQTDNATNPNSDWVQGGFGRGTVDGNQSNGYKVYAEAVDLNTPSPVAHWYGSLPIGNQYFWVDNTGQTGYNGRGLYRAYQNGDFLGESWEINPLSTQFFAQGEGSNITSSSQTCVEIDDGMFGTNGDTLYAKWDSTTELYILNDNSNWIQWDYQNIAATVHEVGPAYNVTTFKYVYAFDAHGGT